MSNDRSTSPASADGSKLPSWLVVVIIVVFFGFAWWNQSQSTTVPVPSTAGNSDSPSTSERAIHRADEILPDENEPSVAETTPEHDQAASAVGSTSSPGSRHSKGPLSGPLANRHTRLNSDSHSNDATFESPSSHLHAEISDGTSYKIENQTIRDLNGNIAFKGTIDLKPTIERIERGESNRHRNDGTSFQNREGRLPRKPSGYYKEFVHPTQGENGPGPQRVIVGQDGEIWYTPDHYKTFKKIKSGKE